MCTPSLFITRFRDARADDSDFEGAPEESNKRKRVVAEAGDDEEEEEEEEAEGGAGEQPSAGDGACGNGELIGLRGLVHTHGLFA